MKRLKLSKGSFITDAIFDKRTDNVAFLAYEGSATVFPVNTYLQIEENTWRVTKAVASQYNPRVVNVRLERRV